MSKEPTKRVQIHVLPLDTLGPREAFLADFGQFLLTEERAQHDRYAFPAARDEYLMSRALCRLGLAAYTGAAPMDFVFARNPHGKPYIVEPLECRSVQFNLTGTRSLVALAIATSAVGLDAEFIPRKTDTVRVAERFFSTRELSALQALPPVEQRRRFFDYWTLKEAYIKARGLGMAIPLGSFSFTLDPIVLHDAPDAEQWAFEQRVFGAHLLGLCRARGTVPATWEFGLPRA